ncbi:hypothetical protein B5790_1260 [Bifidobacterium dentium]|nr:hypothetical protein B5790_1260 [Bifidobacterium dentium]
MGQRSMFNRSSTQNHVSFNTTANTKRYSGNEVIPIRAYRFPLPLLGSRQNNDPSRTPLRQQCAQGSLNLLFPFRISGRFKRIKLIYDQNQPGQFSGSDEGTHTQPLPLPHDADQFIENIQLLISVETDTFEAVSEAGQFSTFRIHSVKAHPASLILPGKHPLDSHNERPDNGSFPGTGLTNYQKMREHRVKHRPRIGQTERNKG